MSESEMDREARYEALRGKASEVQAAALLGRLLAEESEKAHRQGVRIGYWMVLRKVPNLTEEQLAALDGLHARSVELEGGNEYAVEIWDQTRGRRNGA